MSDAIERAIEVLDAVDRNHDLDSGDLASSEEYARALHSAGLLAPAPLREDGVGWYEVIHPSRATTHIAYVHEDGSIYFPEGTQVLDTHEFAFAAARGRAYRLVRADSVNRAEGDGRDEREPTVPASQLRAFARLCVDGGDMTPAAARMLDRIIDGDGRAEG